MSLLVVAEARREQAAFTAGSRWLHFSSCSPHSPTFSSMSIVQPPGQRGIMTLLSFLSDGVMGLSPTNPMCVCRHDAHAYAKCWSEIYVDYLLLLLCSSVFFSERSLIEPGSHQLPKLAGSSVSSLLPLLPAPFWNYRYMPLYMSYYIVIIMCGFDIECGHTEATHSCGGQGLHWVIRLV